MDDFSKKPKTVLGQVTVSSAPKDLEPPVPPDILPEVIGDTGTERYGGYFYEEFSSDWRDEKRVINVELMRRTDATVKQLLNAIKAPILAAEWDVVIDSDDPKDQEVLQFVKDNVFNIKRTWKDFLREALTYFDFGFSAFELIWEKRSDGRIWLADLSPRIQHSILRWTIAGGLHGITQLIKTDEKAISMPEIPMNKLLVLTNDKEGDDRTGQSVLRPAWKHWWYKDGLYRIASIQAERYGVGTPVITLPEGNAGAADMAKAKEMGRSMRSNEEGYIILPSEKWKVTIMTPSGGSLASDIKSQVEHHDRMILMAGLAGFLNLGSTDTGSFALSSDQRGFFLTFIQDKVSYIAEEYTKQVIHRLVELNYGKLKKMPKLQYTNLGENDLTAMSTWMKTLIDAGLVDANDIKIKEWTRKNWKLPLITEEEKADMEMAQVDAALGDMQLPPDDEEETEISDEQPADNISETDAEAPEAKPAETALNGAQIASLKEITMNVSQGMLLPEAAKILIRISFPDIDPETIDDLIAEATKNKIDPATVTK